MGAQEDHSEEIARLERRGEQDPRTHTFARLADLYRKAGDLDRALAVIERGLRHHPHYLNARLVYARILRELGQLVAASEAFAHVLRIDSENLVARAALAELGVEGESAEGDRPPAGSGQGLAASGWLARLDADWRESWAENGANGSAPLGGSEASSERTGPGRQGDRHGLHAVDGGRPQEEAAATQDPGVGGPGLTGDPGPKDEAAEGGGGSAGETVEPSSPGGGEADTPADPPDGKRSVKSEAASPEAAAPAPPGRESGGELETATLAALYVRQGLFDRAIAIYERLLARDPYNARIASALQEARRRSAARQGTPPASNRRPSRPEPGLPARPTTDATKSTDLPPDRSLESLVTPREEKGQPGSVRALLETILNGNQPARPGGVGSRWPAWLEARERDDG